MADNPSGKLIIAIDGPAGAGKSTILACIAGALMPDDGVVTLDDIALFPPPMPL